MFTNLGNYKIVTTTKGAPSYMKATQAKGLAQALVTTSTPIKNGSGDPLKSNAAPRGSKFKEESFYGNGYNASSQPQNLNLASPTSSQQTYTSFLQDFVPVNDPISLRYKYRDMYYYDSICGTAVDLRSELPFSEYTLTGVSADRLQKFQEAMDELNPLQFLRRVLADYFVYGSTAYWLLPDNERKIFSSPVALNLDRCTFIQTPLMNDAPFIDYQMDESMTTFINSYNSGDQRVKKYVEQRPGLLALIALKGNTKVQLDPDETLYLERNDLSYSPKTTVSYYARVLKYYEYEKRIFRGTLDLAEKRLKSILHLTIGNDTILPTADTLTEISNAFKTANLDPTDAIVATHSYVQTNEIRQPTDFWRWDEISDFINRGKMVALGINEQFLSGEMSYASMESALSVFLEQLLWDRTYVTEKIFYKTIFPYVARENDFIADSGPKVTQVLSKDVFVDPLLQNRPQDKKQQYQIPKIVWHKALKPRVDKEWLDTLSLLKDQGIPIPFRMWLTGAGINAEELVSAYKDTENLENEDSIEMQARAYNNRFEQQDDYSNKFSAEDFTSPEEIGEAPEGESTDIEEDLFADDFEEPVSDLEENLTPSLKPASEKENPQLFQGSSLTRIGLKNRMKLGDLNGEEVKERLQPTIADPYGKRRPASTREAAMIDEKFNSMLSQQLANKDQKDLHTERKKYDEYRENSTVTTENLRGSRISTKDK